MAIESKFNDIEISVSDSGRLAPDFPPTKIGPSDYVVKNNFRYDKGYERFREGWDKFAPNAGKPSTPQETMGSLGIKQTGQAERANGETVPIGIDGKTVYWFNWSTGTWVSIGSVSTSTPKRRWQIINIGDYTVFNNGTDLPFTWVIGDTSVTPIYELREQGYASVDEITQSNGMLLCFGITEIIPSELSGVLNSGDPYGPVSPNKTQRYAYRKLWSNIGDARDFAAVVDGNGTAGSPNMSLAWPMSSLVAGDEIVVLGGGAAGGNFTTTISSITSTSLVLAANLITSVTGAHIQKITALSSVVGYMDLADGGGEIMRALPLGNRIVAYKTSGYIFTGYFSGDINEPWVYDTSYGPMGEQVQESRGLRFPYTLIDVGGRYHLYAGDRHFYKFSLGSQEPEVHPVLGMCEDSLFFSQIALLSSIVENDIYAAQNSCTSEIFFKVPFTTPGFSSALVYDYTNEKASVCTDFNFTCAATIRNPSGLKSASRSETIFIMGGADSLVTLYGKTNLRTLTMKRRGVDFEKRMARGMVSFGYSKKVKDVTGYELQTDLEGHPIDISIFGTTSPSKAGSALASFTLNESNGPTLQELWLSHVLFTESISSTAAADVGIIGSLWVVALMDGGEVMKA